MSKETSLPARNEWRRIVAPFQKPSISRSAQQIMTSMVPFFVLTIVNFWVATVNIWLAIPVAFVIAGFIVRSFIIQHDCGHGSFFKSKKAADIVGFICGIITLTPYKYWRRSHNAHHASSGNLSSRGIGDIKTATVREFNSWSPLQQAWYRVYRNPFILFSFGALIQFAFLHRFPDSYSKSWVAERREMLLGNIVILAIWITVFAIFPLEVAFVGYVMPIWIAASVGAWLFYVQHQYEDAYWEHEDSWNYTEAAIKGSSFYKLPKILQWFSGNIGFHHVHHLTPKIPNYYLEECHSSDGMFQQAKTLTIKGSFSAAFLSLWDEDSKRLISFSEYKKMQRSAA
ncbi:MAG: fatty acid desaturase [Opitutales bacterium]